MICCWSHTFRNQCFYTGMLGVRLYSSSILLLGEYMDSLVKTELLIVQQSVLHVHNVFWKKWAPLAEFVMYQISWVQTHRLLPIAQSLLYGLWYSLYFHSVLSSALPRVPHGIEGRATSRVDQRRPSPPRLQVNRGVHRMLQCAGAYTGCYR